MRSASSAISRCCDVTQTLNETLCEFSESARTTGPILMTSGRVPTTTKTFKIFKKRASLPVESQSHMRASGIWKFLSGVRLHIRKRVFHKVSGPGSRNYLKKRKFSFALRDGPRGQGQFTTSDGREWRLRLN